jgi:hypothetical protein
MKAKYLKPTFYEKGSAVKLTFEVPMEESGAVMGLKMGEIYEIAPEAPLLPGEGLTPKQKVQEAIRMLSEAYRGICEAPQGTLDLEPKDDKGEGKCATCRNWIDAEDTGIGRKWCKLYSVYKNIYERCSSWRSNAEEDKAEGDTEDTTEEVGVCESMVEKERSDSGDIEPGSSEEGDDRTGAVIKS